MVLSAPTGDGILRSCRPTRDLTTCTLRVRDRSGGTARYVRRMHLGQLASIDRFAVKSMLGESMERAPVGTSGIAGDRTHALVDDASGKVASAKDPRAWAGLLAFRSRYVGEPVTSNLVVTDPAGVQIRADDPDVDRRLSASVGRPVRLASELGDRLYDYVWEEDG